MTAPPNDDAYQAIIVPAEDGPILVPRDMPCEFTVPADNFPIYVTRGDDVASS